MDPLAPVVKIVMVGELTRDPALADDMDIKAYLDRRDPSLIKCKPGQTPTYFHIAQLSREFVIDQIDTLVYSSQQFRLAFNASCHRVEQPGKQAMIVGDDWASDRGAVPRVAGPSWAKQFDDDFHLQVIYEAGAFAIKRARIPHKAAAPLSSAPSSEPTVSSGQSESAPAAAAK